MCFDGILRTFTGHKDWIRCMHWDGQRMITGSKDRTVRFWDTRTGECQAVMAVIVLYGTL